MKDILTRLDEIMNTTGGPRVKGILVDAYAEIVNLRKRNLGLIETGRSIVDDHTKRTNEAIEIRGERDDLRKAVKGLLESNRKKQSVIDIKSNNISGLHAKIEHIQADLADLAAEAKE